LLRSINPKTLKRLREFIDEHNNELKFDLDGKNFVDFTNVFKKSKASKSKSFLEFKKIVAKDIKRLSL